VIAALLAQPWVRATLFYGAIALAVGAAILGLRKHTQDDAKRIQAMENHNAVVKATKKAEAIRESVRSELNAHPDELRDDDGFRRPD
jgi:hypothetical protein